MERTVIHRVTRLDSGAPADSGASLSTACNFASARWLATLTAPGRLRTSFATWATSSPATTRQRHDLGDVGRQRGDESERAFGTEPFERSSLGVVSTPRCRDVRVADPGLAGRTRSAASR